MFKIMIQRVRLPSNQNKINLTKFSALIILSLLLTNLASYSFVNSASADSKVPCKCVIFRLDDVNSEWLPTVQMYVMDKFISKNQSLSLGIIMHKIDDKSIVVEKIKEGKQAGLFELDIHGWDHVDYTQLSKEEQFTTIQQSNKKMNEIFGIHSDVFIPPYNKFNGDTIEVLKPAGIRIISSDTSNDESDYFTSNIQNEKGSNDVLYHLPSITTFEGDNGNGTWIKIPTQAILDATYFGIEKYGYAVIMLHPQNFAKFNDGQFFDIVDNEQMDSLTGLIDTLRAKNIPISTFSNVVGLKTENPIPIDHVATPEFNTVSYLVLIISLFSSVFISRIYKKILN